MRRCEIDGLDSSRIWWVPAVVAPRRDWAGAPGCRRGARFLVDRETFRASREEFSPFDSEWGCLGWIVRHRPQLDRALPGGRVRAVPLDRWLLGLD
jgi:hypothetical protein